MGYLDGTGLSHLISKIKAAFWSKTDVVQISIDNTPTASSDNLVKSGGVYSALSGKYEKPSGGIPASDLAAGVIPTVPSDLDDLSDVNLGTPSDGDVLTYDSTNQKWVADAPSGGEISADIVADKGDNTKSAGTKAVYDFVKPQSQSSIPAGGLQPGILYNLSVLTGSVTINLATPSDANVANEYAFTFATGGTLPTITWPASLIGWAGNCLDSNGQPELKVSKFYEVSILNNIAIIAEIEI